MMRKRADRTAAWTDQRLIEAAREARRCSYAPYSRFPVGAALLTSGGAVFLGCNVENASFGLTVCAERVALQSAVAAGQRRFLKLAIVTDARAAAFPCGACRQVLAEFCGPDLVVIVAGRSARARSRTTTLGDLLPCAFVLRPRRC